MKRLSAVLLRDAMSIGQIVVPFAGVLRPLNECGAVLRVVCAVDIHRVAQSAVSDTFPVHVEETLVHAAIVRCSLHESLHTKHFNFLDFHVFKHLKKFKNFNLVSIFYCTFIFIRAIPFMFTRKLFFLAGLTWI